MKTLLFKKSVNMVCVVGCAALSFSAAADDIANKFKNAFIGDQTAMNSRVEQQPKLKTRGIILNKTSQMPSQSAEDIPDASDAYSANGNQSAQQNDAMNSGGCQARTKSVALKISFGSNSKNIQNPSDMKGIAESMNSEQLSDCYFIVEGHTDALGDDYYNLWLSQKRAEEVKRYLSNNNVDTERLIVVGKGEDELVNRAAPGSSENRRVVFKVVNYAK